MPRKHRRSLPGRDTSRKWLRAFESLEPRIVLDGQGFQDVVFNQEQIDLLQTGFANLSEWGERLATLDTLQSGFQFVQAVGGEDFSFASLLDLESLIERNIVSPAQEYLDSTAAPVSESLVQAIKAVGTDIVGGELDSPRELVFELDFIETIALNEFGIDFGANGAALGLTLDAAAQGTLNVDLQFSMTMGVKLDVDSLVDPNVSFEDAFFIRDVQLLVNSTAASNSSLSGSIGFADVTATLDLAAANASFLMTIDDGYRDAQGSTTISDLVGVSIDDLVDVQILQNSVDATVIVDATIGSYSVDGIPEIEVQGEAISDVPLSVTTNTDFGSFSEFNNIGPEDLFQGAQSIISLLDAMLGSSLLETPIPFTGGTTVGGVFEFATDLTASLQQMADPQTGLPQFSAQSFAWGDSTTVDYDPSSKILRYDVAIDFAELTNQLPFDLGGGIEALQRLTSNSMLNLSSDATASFTILVDLSNPIEPSVSAVGGEKSAASSASSSLTPTQAISLSGLQIDGDLDLSLDNFLGDGLFGMLGIAIGDGTLAGNLGFDLTLPTVGSLSEILVGLADPASLLEFDLDGALDFLMGNISVLDDFLQLPDTAGLRLRVEDIAAGVVELLPVDLGDLDSFSDVSLEDVLALLESQQINALTMQLQDKVTEAIAFLDTEVAEIVDATIGQFASEAREVVEGVLADGQEVLSIQNLASYLEQNVRVEGVINVGVTSVFDTSSQSLLLNVDLQVEGDTVAPFDLDFAPWQSETGGSTLGDFSLGGQFVWDADGVLSLDLGLDLSTPNAPVPYLYDTSRLDLGLFTGAAVEGTLHGLGLALEFDGTGRISSTTDLNQPATFAVTLESTPAGRVAASDLGSLQLDTAFDGQLDINLDTQLLPTTSAATQPLHVVIADLTDPLGSASILEIPNFQEMLDNISLSQTIAALAQGVDELLTRVETAMDRTIGAIRLPLVGGALEPANAVGKFHDFLQPALDVIGAYDAVTLKKTVEDALEDAFGDTVTVTIDDSDPLDVTLQIVSVGKDDIGASIDSDLGLPALGIAVQGEVEINANHEFDLTFGVNPTDGVYMLTSQANELEMTLDVLYDGQLEGRFGFLEITAQNANDPDEPAFSASLDLDITDPNGDGKLTVSELSQFRFAQHITPTVQSEIDLAIQIETAIRGQEKFPSILAQLNVDWDYELGSDAVAPGVSLTNVGINLGDFLSQMASPFFADVYDTIEPILPLIEFVTSPLPVISDFVGSDVTVVDVIQEVFPNQNLEFLDTVESILRIVTQLDLAQTDAGQIVLPFKNLPFDRLDLRDPEALSELNLDALVGGLGDNPWDDLVAASQVETVRNFALEVNSSPGEFDFALLSKPTRIFELLLGLRNDVELVTWDVPSLQVYLPFDYSFTVAPFINAGFFGAIEFVADLNVGYDTFGLSKFQDSKQLLDLLDGFYVSDTAFPDGTGPDVPEAYVRGEAKAQASIGVPGLLEGGVAGGIVATLGADLVDSNGDGKLRASEILHPGGCLFAMGGDVILEFELFAKAVGQRYDYPFAQHELASFSLTPNCPYLVQPFPDDEETLAVLESDGSLRLLVGDDASQRSVQQDVINETYLVNQVDGTIFIQAFNHIQTFSTNGVRRIVASAGSGSDAITVVTELPVEIQTGDGRDYVEVRGLFNGPDGSLQVGGILVDAGADDDQVIAHVGAGTTLRGNDGDDVLQISDAESKQSVAILEGGSGDDVLQGNRNVDRLFGGSGDDELFTGDGANYVETGAGNDFVRGGMQEDVITALAGGENTIFGGGGVDTIKGGPDNDIIHGEDGSDQIDAGPGDDTVVAGSGDDTVEGGPGEDLIFGGAGEDTLNGGDDNDEILGDADADTIHGDQGDDEILGGDGEDEIDGDLGADEIDGGSGSDTIRGGDGPDRIFGGAGADHLEGNADPDQIDGGSGNDVILGGTHADTLRGGTGDDEIEGNEGDDWADGEAGNDEIRGNTGADELSGGPGEDAIFGNQHRDTIDGGPDNDRLFGNDDVDTVFGGLGDDYIEGNAADDELFGGPGDDHLRGGIGSDTMAGGDGNDLLYGQQGDDLLRGGNDEDLLLGNSGDDQLFGNAGKDILRGGLGDDLLDGGDDDDRAFGGEGDDLIRGGKGNDTLDDEWGIVNAFGNEGDDLILGGFGVGRMHGGPGNDAIYAENGVGNWLQGADGDDLLVGSGDGKADLDKTGIPTGDIIEGGNGKDTIRGLGGADRIDGGGDIDTIDGGSDEDEIDGGDDGDILFESTADTIIGSDFNAIARPESVTEERLAGGKSDADLSNWKEIGGSASGDGITQVGGREQASITVGDRQYVAWVDDRNGSHEIYLARSSTTGDSWSQINGSASGGGVSDSEADSRRPSLLAYGDAIIVAWAEVSPDGSNLMMAAFEGTLPFKISELPGQTGTADFPKLAAHRGGFSMSWLDGPTGTREIMVAEYRDNDIDPSKWLGAQPVPDSQGAIHYDFSASEFHRVVAWSKNSLSGRSVMAATRNNTVPDWAPMDSFDGGYFDRPTLATRIAETFGSGESSLETYLAMEWLTDEVQQIVAYRSIGEIVGTSSAWEPLESQFIGDEMPRADLTISDTIGHASRPDFATSLATVGLGWLDDNFLASADGETDVYLLSSQSGGTLFEALPGDASETGISPTGSGPRELQVNNAGGHLSASWTETGLARPQAYLRQRINGAADLQVPSIGVAGHSIEAVVTVDQPDRQLVEGFFVWGDGETSQGETSRGAWVGEHVYADLGSYAIQATVVDQAGLIYSALGSVAIERLKIDPPSAIQENQRITLNGQFFDDAPFHANSVRVRWGDSSVWLTTNLASDANSFSLQHLYEDDPPFSQYSVQVEVLGIAASSVSESLSVTVENVPPVFSVGADTEVLLRDEFSRRISFSDPGLLDEHDATIDWGDGTTPTTQTLPVGSRFVDLEYTYTAAGEFVVTVEIDDDDGGSHSETFTINVVRDPEAPPTVIGVQVGSRQWSEPFVEAIADRLLLGYPVPRGSNAQLDVLPWSNLDQIHIAFSKPVTVEDDALQLPGVNVGDYREFIDSFKYDTENWIASWTLTAPIGADRLQLRLRSQAIADKSDRHLDGEWTDGQSIESGDGRVDGDFSFTLNVLPGDADQNQIVNDNDLDAVRSSRFQIAGFSPEYSAFEDIDGSAVVTGRDLGEVRIHRGATLPPFVFAVSAVPATPASLVATDQWLAYLESRDKEIEALFAAREEDSDLPVIRGSRRNSRFT